MPDVRLLEFLNLLIPESREHVSLIARLFENRILKKGAVVLREGEICTAFYFVEKGHLRTHFNKDGVDINLHFHLDGDITSDYKNGKIGKPSEFTITAGENSEIWILDRKTLEQLCYADPEIMSFGKKLVFRLLMDLTSQGLIFRIYSPRERYNYLRENHPKLLQRVSLSNLASYLGMTRRTLTRIRAER